MRYIVLILAMAFAFSAKAQTSEATIFDESTIVYRNSVYGGAILHTNGWGAHLTFGKFKTAFKSRILQFEVVGIKHEKEIRTYYPYSDDSRSYIYGKLNSFFVFRPTYGMRKTVFDKIRKSGVAIGYNWRIGPSLGFTKPVYLEILVDDANTGGFDDVIVERYDPEMHFKENILARASWFKGLDDLKFHPGIHGAFGINFEYDSERSGISGIEVGTTIDYYPIEEIEIMAFAENRNLFLNFYLNLQFGKKFNK